LPARRYRILALAVRGARRHQRENDAASLARRQRHRLYARGSDGGAVPAAARQEAVRRPEADHRGGSNCAPGRADLFRPLHRPAEKRFRDALPDGDPEPRRDRQLAAAELRGQGRRADSQVSPDDAERAAGEERDPSETAGRPHRYVARIPAMMSRLRSRHPDRPGQALHSTAPRPMRSPSWSARWTCSISAGGTTCDTMGWIFPAATSAALSASSAFDA